MARVVALVIVALSLVVDETIAIGDDGNRSVENRLAALEAENEVLRGQLRTLMTQIAPSKPSTAKAAVTIASKVQPAQVSRTAPADAMVGTWIATSDTEASRVLKIVRQEVGYSVSNGGWEVYASADPAGLYVRDTPQPLTYLPGTDEISAFGIIFKRG